MRGACLRETQSGEQSFRRRVDRGAQLRQGRRLLEREQRLLQVVLVVVVKMPDALIVQSPPAVLVGLEDFSVLRPPGCHNAKVVAVFRRPTTLALLLGNKVECGLCTGLGLVGPRSVVKRKSPETSSERSDEQRLWLVGIL